MAQSEESNHIESRVFGVLIVAIGILAVITRFYHLAHESLWMDEAITFARARSSLAKLSENAVRHYHNPTYFILVHYVMKLGDSEFVLRLPSAVAGVLKGLAVLWLGNIVAGRRVGVIAAVIVLLLPSQLRYDQEARMYGLLGLATTLAMCGVFRLLNNLGAASAANLLRPLTNESQILKRARRSWQLYVGATAFALYLHNTAVLFALTCSAALIGGGVSLRERSGFLRNWLIAHVLIALVFLPWLPTLFHQSDKMLENGWWAVEPDVQTVVTTLSELYGLGAGRAWLLIPLSCLALYGAISVRSNRVTMCALLLLTVGGPALLALVTLYQPMYVLRLMLWSAIPFVVLLALGILALRPKPLSYVLIGTIVCCGLAWLKLGYYSVRQKPDWRKAAEFIASEAKPSDSVLATGGGEGRSLYYYLRRRHQQLRPFSFQTNIKEMAADVTSFVNRNSEAVWTIHLREKPETRRIHQQLLQLSTKQQQFHFGPELLVERYLLMPVEQH